MPPETRRSRVRLLLTAVLTAVCALAALLAVAAPSAAAVAPTLQLSAASAAAGTPLDIAGSGFGRRVRGSVLWHGQLLARFRTDVQGRFSLSAPVPVQPTGTVVVTAEAEGRSASASFTTLQAPVDEPATPVGLPPLTWRAPSTAGFTTVTIDRPGTYDLRSDVDYVVSAPARIDGAVHLRGGRHVVWIGGHISIPDLGTGATSSAQRRGLVVSDHDSLRGNPTTYGASQTGRVVHLEGLLIDGPHLTEGINTNAPSAVLQLQNIRVDGVHFRNSDDRDGTNGWSKNHPDVLQTWGSQRELRVDGLTGSSAYQGIFLKEDAVDAVRGPVWLRRVDVTAVERTGTDGTDYAGHRMLSWYSGRVGRVHLDTGTVRVTSHVRSGWNRRTLNPDPTTGFWRGRYWSATAGKNVLEPPPGDAVFHDALGDTAPDLTGADATGTYAGWSTGVTDWSGTAPGRVYSGPGADGPFVPAGTAGLSYVSPGYVS